MQTSYGEPTIHDLLNDPLTRAVMKADGVDPQALRRMLGSVACEIARADRQADYQPRRRQAPLAVAAGGSGPMRWLHSNNCGAR
jgi:hypothetical protein